MRLCKVLRGLQDAPPILCFGLENPCSFLDDMLFAHALRSARAEWRVLSHMPQQPRLGGPRPAASRASRRGKGRRSLGRTGRARSPASRTDRRGCGGGLAARRLGLTLEDSLTYLRMGLEGCQMRLESLYCPRNLLHDVSWIWAFCPWRPSAAQAASAALRSKQAALDRGRRLHDTRSAPPKCRGRS
jgi:hypothetical protein